MTIRHATALLATGAILLLAGAPAHAFGHLGFDAECWATGFGVLEPGDPAESDLFWGFAASDGGSEQAAGTWIHATPRRAVSTPWGAVLRRDLFVGRVEFAACERNGAFLVTIGGSGRWNGVAGHHFEVVVLDRFDDNPDTYGITVLRPDGSVVYDAFGSLARGDVTSVGTVGP